MIPLQIPVQLFVQNFMQNRWFGKLALLSRWKIAGSIMLKWLRPLVQPYLQAHSRRFQRALDDPRAAQQQLLETLISKLAATDYGRSLHIKSTDDYEGFAAKTPVVSYDDLRDWILRQMQTEARALIAEPVLFYEKTSGSSGAAKYIPYTASLKQSFNRMFLIWVADLLAQVPLRTGKTFISISPAFQQTERSEQGKPIGLTDDAEYLRPALQLLMRRFLVLPAGIKQLKDPIDFKRAFAVLLLAEESLEVISIWNPSFFEVLLDFIQNYHELLLDDLRRGFLRVQDKEFKFKIPDAKRLALLEEKPIDWQKVWAELKLISCWTSAHAASAAARFRALLPQVFLQGKGLLATEAPLTLPLINANGYVPMVSEVFFEFLDAQGSVLRLHELEAGRDYEVIITQHGGLYRYRLGDLVRATHFYKETICLEFIGRSDRVCDLVGEKLNENFVRDSLSQLSSTPAFQMLLPVAGKSPFYLLITDNAADGESRFAEELDRHLCRAFHYRQARQLGQLEPARVVVVPQAREIYYDYYTGKGMKAGDIKQQFLVTNTEDAERLCEVLGQRVSTGSVPSKKAKVKSKK